MRAVAALLTAVLLGVPALGGCAADARRSGIVVTTNILGDVTRAVVGDQAEVTVLMRPNADPHSFGVSAQDAARLERAALILHNGLGLEEGVARPVLAAAEQGVPTLAVAEQVAPIDYAGRPDPHFWTDPSRMRTAVTRIADQVSRTVPGVDPAVIARNAESYATQVGRLDAEAAERFAAIPRERRKLVTNHHVFGYLALRYDFQVIGTVLPGGTTLASPSAADLARLADTVRAAGVPVIFADSSQPDRLARVLAERAGLRVRVVPLFSESLTEPGQGAATYLEMVRANTEAIATALRD